MILKWLNKMIIYKRKTNILVSLIETSSSHKINWEKMKWVFNSSQKYLHMQDQPMFSQLQIRKVLTKVFIKLAHIRNYLRNWNSLRFLIWYRIQLQCLRLLISSVDHWIIKCFRRGLWVHPGLCHQWEQITCLWAKIICRLQTTIKIFLRLIHTKAYYNRIWFNNNITHRTFSSTLKT